jgi:DNA-binding response OmpR family regulator
MSWEPSDLRGEPLVMQPQQFRVLVALGKHAGQVLSREQLMELAFEDACAVDAAPRC